MTRKVGKKVYKDMCYQQFCDMIEAQGNKG